jgi:dsRNA-specific ribonuclease
MKHNKPKEGNYNMPKKTIADSVEAFIGAAYEEGGENMATKYATLANSFTNFFLNY